MGEKLVIGPITKGQQTNVEPFYIDQDSFPTLINAYTWRGRVKRKRGTSLLCRLQRFFSSTVSSYNPAGTTLTLSNVVGHLGEGNIITAWSLSGSIIPGSVVITGGAVYTDQGDGTFSPSGTINYATGDIVIAAQAGVAVSAVFRYYPVKPVMGLRDFSSTGSSDNYPLSIAFDTKYSYNIETVAPFRAYDVSFYKNPAAGTPYPASYVPKTNITPLVWNGEDYQLFWTADYENSLFTTNGVTVPFDVTNIGMQYKAVTNVVIVAGGPPASATFTIGTHSLVIGDFLFFNEFSEASITGLNFQTGYVTATVANVSVTVTFPNATLAGAAGAITGIAQYLTSNSDSTKDTLRFYDGDPTDSSVVAPTLNGRKGWVNFCPPLSNSIYSIGQLPEDKYYLVGARVIVPFKDRLLFIGPVIQTSAAGSQQYLQDVIIYSQNGTPYYTASFTGNLLSADTIFHPLLTPQASTNTQILGATPTAFFEDVTGYGGNIQAGFNEPILTAIRNQDVLIMGFETTKSKLVYTGNEIVPFNFYFIDSEFGDSSTFAAVPLDRGVISKGTFGYIMSTQSDSNRVDLQIPDDVFEVRLDDNGQERVIAQRDYINEWIYFSYPSKTFNSKDPSRFPTVTLQYNYREQSWATFHESYTAYGNFRQRTGYTWLTIGDIFPTWNQWTEAWDAGSTTLLQPDVIAGNQQGFVLKRDQGTAEGNSLQITSFSGTNGSLVTSVDHGLSNGDYILISGAIGTISTQVNGKIFSVNFVNKDTFYLDPTISTGTYVGGGVIKKMYVPFIQTKQFPLAWSMGRKTRIGVQQYLLTATNKGQIQLLIYLNQSGDTAYNQGNIVPSNNVQNNSLVYNSILYTCPESTNLGLTAPNVNLQNLIGNQAQRIWHRMNTSLIGDSVQVGFTMSEDQMRDVNFNNQFSEIEIHSMIFDVTPSSMLS